MKHHLFFLSLLAATFPLPASPPMMVNVTGQDFFLADSKQSDSMAIAEYVPSGETLSSWTKLVSLREFKDLDSPGEYIGKMAEKYEAKFPDGKAEVGHSDDEKLWYIDFTMHSDSGQPRYVEWNYFTARENPKGGLLVCQYAQRRRYHEERERTRATEQLDIPALRQIIIPRLHKSFFWEGGLPGS